MSCCPTEIVYSEHEKWVTSNAEISLLTEEGKKSRERVNRILKRMYMKQPKMDVQRARYFVESFRETEHLPLTLRWAKAMANVMEKIEIYIKPDDLIVGRGGAYDRYGILYPELDGDYFSRPGVFDDPEAAPEQYDPEGIKIILEEIAPYWKGKTLRCAMLALLPDDIRNLVYRDGDPDNLSLLVMESASARSSLQWVLDYEKVLKIGFEGIKACAQHELDTLDVNNPKHNYDKMPFYQAVIIVCDAIHAYALRHADKARELAAQEEDPVRKKELLLIADVCEWVPWKPARSFHEAIQAQWFTQLASRFEQIFGGIVGNGRIDQYLYPYYKKDVEAGILDEHGALELLECLWLNMAQYVYLHAAPQGRKRNEGNAHFEHTTISGQTRDSKDATNELSWLILKSKHEFPLDFPDLSVRIHAGTPDDFLHRVCEVIKHGTGFPKLFNDEEIIPVLVAKGATLEEARDYAGSGCTEVRLVNRNTYFTGTTWFSLPGVLELALNNGKCTATGDNTVSIQTGDAAKFATYEAVWNAFTSQLKHIIHRILAQQYIADTLRPHHLAGPLQSALHDVAMKEGKDLAEGRFEEGLSLGPQVGVIGFGTTIDSLAAIRKLVFEDGVTDMPTLLAALRNNFEGYEILRQQCLNAPKYGNCIEEVDEVGRQIEELLNSELEKHTNYYGGKPEIFHVPVTIHIAMGRKVGAMPNGRRSGEFLSEGISPSQGADVLGPTCTLKSIAYTKNTPYFRRAARLLNIKLMPRTVAGEEGTQKLAAFIRGWSKQRHWHLQFNIVNNETLKAAQAEPEKYRNLIVRVAGYSAYFVELSQSLQSELVHRTEHSSF